VGFYLAYMNALACWLIVPAVFGTFLLWGPLGSTKSHAAGMSMTDCHLWGPWLSTGTASCIGCVCVEPTAVA
jgi:hypothetical protein